MIVAFTFVCVACAFGRTCSSVAGEKQEGLEATLGVQSSERGYKDVWGLIGLELGALCWESL